MPQIVIPEAFAYLYQGEARHRWSKGGRGSGKSHAFAQRLVLKGAERPIFWLCGREIQNSLRDSVRKLLIDKAEACGLAGFYRVVDNEIRGANGTRFVFAGLWSHPDSVKSMEGLDGAWVEEAATVSERSIDLLRNTVRKKGSELWWTWNPRFENDPVDRMFSGDKLPPRSVGRVVNFDNNKWFPDELREEMEWDRDRDPDKYAHIWLGDYQRNAAATVFKNWRLWGDDDPTPDDSWVWDYGADWGFSVDPTAMLRVCKRDRKLYIDHELRAVNLDIDLTPAFFAGDDPRTPKRWENPKGFKGMPGALKWEITADSARPETIAYMRQRSFKMIAAQKGAGSVDEGIEFLKSHDIIVHPRCTHTIDELTLFAYEIDKKTEAVLPMLKKKQSDHMIDCARYALERRRRKGVEKPVGPLTVPRVSPYLGATHG